MKSSAEEGVIHQQVVDAGQLLQKVDDGIGIQFGQNIE